MRKSLKVVAFGGDPADAFLKAAGITDATITSAVKTLVRGLQADGLWSKMKAIYPMVGGNATAHSYNLKDTTKFQITFNGGWTHSSTGAQGNGTNNYANTNLLHNSLTQNSTHVSYYSRTNAFTNTQDIGVGDDSNSFLLLEINRNQAGGIQSTIINSNTRTGALSQGDKGSLGFYIGSRTASNSQKLYKNGISIQTNTANSTSLLNKNIFINSYNGPSGAVEFSNKECAFSTIGDGLSDTEAFNLYTRIQTFQVTLGRNVGAPIVSDSDAQSFLNTASITDLTQANAVNTLVTDLKSANLWTKMIGLYPMVGGTASTHSYNLKNPAQFQITFNGGWTHSSTGALPNGSNGYADTGILGGTNITGSSCGIGIYSGSQTTSTGGFGAGTGFHIYTRYTDNNTYYRIANGGAGGVDNGSSLGLIHGYGNGTNGYGFYNGSKKITISSNPAEMNTQNIFFGGQRPASSNYDNHQIRLAFASTYLTDTEASNLYTIVQNYQTSLSRQV